MLCAHAFIDQNRQVVDLRWIGENLEIDAVILAVLLRDQQHIGTGIQVFGVELKIHMVLGAFPRAVGQQKAHAFRRRERVIRFLQFDLRGELEIAAGELHRNFAGFRQHAVL